MRTNVPHIFAIGRLQDFMRQPALPKLPPQASADVVGHAKALIEGFAPNLLLI